MTTWTPKAKQVETWTEELVPVTLRIFDPRVFDNLPIFDTGAASGVWAEKDRQPEIWTPVA